jgi:hypothetical protein
MRIVRAAVGRPGYACGMGYERRYAPRYVLVGRRPGVVGAFWWLASIGLVLDQPVGLLFHEATLGLWSLPVGAVSWALYSVWRVATTHMWHSGLAQATLGRVVYRRYPSVTAVRTGDYFDG